MGFNLILGRTCTVNRRVVLSFTGTFSSLSFQEESDSGCVEMDLLIIGLPEKELNCGPGRSGNK